MKSRRGLLSKEGLWFSRQRGGRLPGRQGQEPGAADIEGERKAGSSSRPHVALWGRGVCSSTSSEARSWTKTSLMLGTDMCLFAQQSGRVSAKGQGWGNTSLYPRWQGAGIVPCRLSIRIWGQFPFHSVFLRPQFHVSPVTGEFPPLPVTSPSSSHTPGLVSLTFSLFLVRSRSRRCFSTL